MDSAPRFTGAGAPLTALGLQVSADYLSVSLAELWAVVEVETRGCGFLPDRRPTILFERHVFSRKTQGRFDKSAPDISCPEPGGYDSGVAEYARLERALALDARAALQSASWGLGQVMGFNAPLTLFGSPAQFVRRMMAGEGDQLYASVCFIWHDAGEYGLADALRRHDWAAFARRYNGPDYRKNQYDEKLEAAYRRLSTQGLPDLRVRELQVLLTYLGFEPGPVDGAVGPRTRVAVTRFLSAHHLHESRQDNDDALLESLRARHAALPRNEAVPEKSEEVRRG